MAVGKIKGLTLICNWIPEEFKIIKKLLKPIVILLKTSKSSKIAYICHTNQNDDIHGKEKEKDGQVFHLHPAILSPVQIAITVCSHIKYVSIADIIKAEK